MAVNERHYPGMGQIIANVTLASGIIFGTGFFVNELRKGTLPALSVEGGQALGDLPINRAMNTPTKTPEPTLIPSTPTLSATATEYATTTFIPPTLEASATPEFDLSKAVKLNKGDTFVLDGNTQKLVNSFIVDNYGYVPGPGMSPINLPKLVGTDYVYLNLVFEQDKLNMSSIKESIKEFRYIDYMDGVAVLVAPTDTHLGAGTVGKKRSMISFKVPKGLNEYNIRVPRYGTLNVEAVVLVPP